MFLISLYIIERKPQLGVNHMATLVTTYNADDKILDTFQFECWSDAIEFTVGEPLIYDMKAGTIHAVMSVEDDDGNTLKLNRDRDVVKFTVELIT